MQFMEDFTLQCLGVYSCDKNNLCLSPLLQHHNMISMINRFLFGIRVFLFSYLISGWTECSHYLPFHHTRHALKVWYEMHYFQIHSTRIIYIYIILSLHMLCPTSADVLGKSLIGSGSIANFQLSHPFVQTCVY